MVQRTGHYLISINLEHSVMISLAESKYLGMLDLYRSIIINDHSMIAWPDGIPVDGHIA